MKTLTSCQSLQEALIIQSILQGSGVESFIPDEYTVQNDWGLINAIGGVRVLVAEEKLKEAKLILTQNSNQDDMGSAK